MVDMDQDEYNRMLMQAAQAQAIYQPWGLGQLGQQAYIPPEQKDDPVLLLIEEGDG